ncbi:MAG: class I mannose-6-phosphate isomerase [Clostridia bacterium]|nr:class I mannose-6-phosphate isomerase [Clostridia bacterium]
MSTILKLTPSFKDYIWGGNKLMKEYGVTDMDRVAEAWVLSAHPDGPSYLPDGSTFVQALEQAGAAALGAKAAAFKDFPQLIKLIDARSDLSVQVHPSDEYALANEGQFGKTEMWYILDAEEGAGIYYGFQRDVTRAEMEEAIRTNTLTDILRFVPVQKGESYFIPSGTIHAIGKGLLIAEIQQNSNVTYRVYDYGRRDAQGNTRPLHVEKALEVSDLTRAADAAEPTQVVVEGGVFTQVSSCSYFTVTELKADGTVTVGEPDSFTAVLVLEGEGTIAGQPFGRYDTFFIPADAGEVKLSGCFTALLSTL